MYIEFLKRPSEFLAPCKQSIVKDRDQLESGTKLMFSLVSGGYPGTVTASIEQNSPDKFQTDWQGDDVSRFPSRLKSVATALRDLSLFGNYIIQHHDGVITIQQTSGIPVHRPGTPVPRSEQMLQVAFFLAKFSSGNNPPILLKTTNWADAYHFFYDSLADGRGERTFANSLNNGRDEFDRYLPENKRKGWDRPLSATARKVLKDFQPLIRESRLEADRAACRSQCQTHQIFASRVTFDRTDTRRD